MLNPESQSLRMMVVLLLVAVAGGSGSVSAPPPSVSQPPLEFQPEVVEEQPEVVAQPIMEEDYPIFNPTPYFDGVGGAPIPHARAVCCCCHPHSPCCNRFQQQRDAFAHST
ncbi:hypothetical protein Salat_1233200 [Sesamum alatum]|uniref:Secreted protein n=1 Tax=Sesamum alatum TaxID=300844 RepID=A0AAE1YGU6_9LAMI|nr:hypothetical protein Salat_1233200 [Sesamum alatum]